MYVHDALLQPIMYLMLTMSNNYLETFAYNIMTRNIWSPQGSPLRMQKFIYQFLNIKHLLRIRKFKNKC